MIVASMSRYGCPTMLSSSFSFSLLCLSSHFKGHKLSKDTYKGTSKRTGTFMAEIAKALSRSHMFPTDDVQNTKRVYNTAFMNAGRTGTHSFPQSSRKLYTSSRLFTEQADLMHLVSRLEGFLQRNQQAPFSETDPLAVVDTAVLASSMVYDNENRHLQVRGCKSSSILIQCVPKFSNSSFLSCRLYMHR